MTARWHFNVVRPGDRNRESQVAKFFKAENERATSVVREGIQNSLDAAPDDKVAQAGHAIVASNTWVDDERRSSVESHQRPRMGLAILQAACQQRHRERSWAQGGIVIPKEIRPYFPALDENLTSPENPTVDTGLVAELFNGWQFLISVETRYTFQTWSGTRSPEGRITQKLNPLRKLAREGDLLLMQRSRELNLHITPLSNC